MRYLLDTCVLIADAPPALPADAEWAISVASLSELHFGVLVASDDQTRAARLQRLTVIENTLNALPVTAEVARIHGAMAARLKAAGRQPRPRATDLLIAATTASAGAGCSRTTSATSPDSRSSSRSHDLRGKVPGLDHGPLPQKRPISAESLSRALPAGVGGAE